MEIVKKNRKSFEQFIAEITPMFTMMGIIDHAEMIGISYHELVEAMKRPEIEINKVDQKSVLILIKIINIRISDEELKNKIISKIMFFQKHGQFIISDNSNKFQATYYTDEDVVYNFDLSITDNKIKYIFNDSLKKIELCGEYQLLKNSDSIINYNDIKTEVFNSNDGSKYYDIKKKRVVLTFDSAGIQNFQYEKEISENFDFDVINDIKTLRSPSPFENKTETRYAWRATKNSIILKEKKEYGYESENKIWGYNCFMIGKNINPDAKRLPKGGIYTWFDEELYKKYIKGEILINDIWENLGDKYQKQLKK